MRTQLRGPTWSTWTHSWRATRRSTRSTPASCRRSPRRAVERGSTPGAVVLRRGRSAGRRRLGGPQRLDGAPPRRRGDPGARARRELRPPVAADRAWPPPSPCARASDRPARCSAPTPARRVLGTEAGAAYVASSMRKRLTRGPHRSRAARRRHHAGVGDHAPGGRSASRASRSATAARAARRRDGVSALLVALDDGQLGIVTDSDIRARGCRAAPLDAPVSTIARMPAPTVPVGQLAVEATVDMLAAGVEHLVRARRRADLRRAVGRRPARSRRAQPDRAAPHGSSARPTRKGCSRAAAAPAASCSRCCSRAGVPPRDLGRVLSLQHDAVVTRLIDFSIAAARAGARVVGVARSRQRRAAGVHARLRPGQRARLRTPRPGARRRRLLRSGSAPTSTQGSSMRDSASTTTACSPATGCGGCRRRTGCGRSTSA